jgi:hypothetical protein
LYCAHKGSGKHGGCDGGFHDWVGLCGWVF